VEDQELTFDYTVHQKNKDPWNLLLASTGTSTNNSRGTWNTTGSSARAKAFIASVNWRF